MAKNKSPAFYEAGSWYHRIKVLQEDGTTKYSKKGGFTTAKDAEESYKSYEKQYQDAYRAYHIRSSRDFALKDYLIYWLEDVFSQRVESSTKMLSGYVLYDLLLPQMVQDVKLKQVNVEYLDALLEKVAPVCKSAGNKSRELLNMALKEAVVQGYIPYNPVPSTKPYKRPKVRIIVLNKEEIRHFLEYASENNWYLEILLGLFMGLRKGDDDDKIRLNQRKPSKYKGLRRFGPEKNLQRINKFMKERPIFYKNLIQMKENIRFYLRCFYCITKVMILQFNSENRTELARNG